MSEPIETAPRRVFCDATCRDVYRARRRWGQLRYLRAWRVPLWRTGPECPTCGAVLRLTTEAGIAILPPVTLAIRKAFPKDAESILGELRWFGAEGCYGFNRWGMFVGVEPDGYIHT